MPTPLVGANALANPIDAGNYVNDINGNFTKITSAMQAIYSEFSSATNVQDLNHPPTLEVNGDFRITRWLNLLSKAQSFPLASGLVATSGFQNLGTGGLTGVVGSGGTEYVPTQFVGWFIQKDLLAAAGTPGTQDSGDYSASFAFSSGTRTVDLPNEELPVIFQPVSFHAPPEMWAGKTITISIRYTTIESGWGRLYAAWNDTVSGETRVEEQSVTTFANGTEVTEVLTVVPSENATYFEIGVLLESANSFALKIHSLYASANPRRRADSPAPSLLPYTAAVAERYYCHAWQHAQRSLMVSSSNDMMSSSNPPDVYAEIPSPKLFQRADVDTIGWPSGARAIYSLDLMAEGVADPTLGVTFESADSPTLTTEMLQFDSGGLGTPSWTADGTENYALSRPVGVLQYECVTANLHELVPCCQFNAWGEISNAFMPLF